MGIVLPSSVFLFFGGLAFSFFFVLPAGIRFFLGFGNTDLEPLFSIDKYLDFVIAFVLPFGVIFELPLVIVILAKLGFVSSAFLRKKRKLVIFLTFVVGAVISPTPDVFSQSMKALEAGLSNLTKHIENIHKYGLPAVVAINAFPTDTKEELDFVEAKCKELGAEVALSEVWAKGGEGGLALADKVAAAMGAGKKAAAAIDEYLKKKRS